MSDIAVPPMSKDNIKGIANKFRETIGFSNKLYFPIVQFLEYFLEDLGYQMEIVEDHELNGAYAVTYPNEKLLKIRESVYNGAVNNNPRDRFTLAHELGHIILHPIEIIGDLKLARTNDIIPAYRNPEWQANTFAGELLAPGNLIVGMDKEEISERCKISLQAAGIRYSDVSGESLLHKKRATV